eukprot:TRINITY_DN8999_c0_g1_i1.p1 TRINITY_DN8999_c0_g1~~TRINITY_DN8999_c0_g1_i1.p1  ORF type:complete len:445 (+),score=89.31 TRINITY_DN8999_c0_g1_i1:69-1403(+)
MRPSQSAEFTSLLKSAGLRPTATDQVKKKVHGGGSGWTLIDADGNTLMLEADKYAIMHRVGIHARDLRILDPHLSYPSTILGRERAIVLNLEGIRAIITADEVLLRDSGSEEAGAFVTELLRRVAPPGAVEPPAARNDDAESDADENDHQHHDDAASERARLRAPSPPPPASPHGAAAQDHHDDAEQEDDWAPFEFVALEVALELGCKWLASQSAELENAAYPALDALTYKVSSMNLERVRRLKNTLSRLSARVQKVRDELEQLLDDDDDMADMFLTRKISIPYSPGASTGGGGGGAASVLFSPTIASRISRGGSRGTLSTFVDEEDQDVEELEQLLEAYFAQIDGIINQLNALREYIDDTEDYINIQIDNKRNQLIQLEMVLNAATTMVAIYSVVVGLFGVNIPYDWNTVDGVFEWIVIVTTVVCAVVFVALICYARYRRIIE